VRYPSLNDISLRVRAGSAIAVIVEGEELGGDAWVYGDIWFAHRATEIRFFPQDGWTQVRDAVQELRRALPGYPIYGLIDRDFTPDGDLCALEAEGVFRSRLYSVENYLLDPAAWHAVFSLVARPTKARLPATLATPAAVAATIEACYHQCRPVSAFNWTVADTAREHPEYVGAPEYLRSIRDARVGAAGSLLDSWRTLSRCQTDLSELYRAKLDLLSKMVPEDLRCHTDGKLVMETLIREFLTVFAGRGLKPVEYLNLYLRECPTPPQEAIDLLSRIEAAYERDRRTWSAGAQE
jgi:hypothetical protein